MPEMNSPSAQSKNRVLVVGPQSTNLPSALMEENDIVSVPDVGMLAAEVAKGSYAGVWISASAFNQLQSLPADSAFQTKLETLYRAGLELAELAPDQLAELSAQQRIDRLKANILKQIKQILGYDRVDIRLLQPQTGLLEPLVCEGMEPEAEKLELYARTTGYGTSGYVAATGESYYCPDTANDPLYIAGAASTQSSLTVPLPHQGQLVGVMTIDSPHREGFTPADRQMLELFGREIGAAIHTLRLLSTERRDTASASVELISREVAVPVDAILSAAASLLDRYIGLDLEMTEQLQLIRTQARSIKACVMEAGQALVPSEESKVVELKQPLRDLKVLVVDADDRVLRSARKILARLGCDVETAHTAKEAVTMARHTHYHFALVDLKLPDSMGYDTFVALREVDPELRVALMSAFGYDPSHSIVRAKAEGLAGALYKPFRVDQLLDVLNQPPAEPANPTQPG